MTQPTDIEQDTGPYRAGLVGLPLTTMLADAGDLALHAKQDFKLHKSEILDVCTHVQALVAAVGELQAENIRLVGLMRKVGAELSETAVGLELIAKWAEMK